MYLGQVIAVTSGKGGTGKTTTVAAVSSCLAVLGYKTLCIDFDSGLKNLDLALCMPDYTVADFLDVIDGRLDLMAACHESPNIENLFFLAAPTFYYPGEPDVETVKPMFENIRGEFDFCLVDSPAGIGQGFRLAHADADMSIVVTNGELPAIRDAQRAAEEIRAMGVEDVRLLVNRVKPKNFTRIQTTIDDIINTVGARLIGAVQEDDSVFLSLHENTLLILYKKRAAAYNFLDVARRIAGEDVPLRLRRSSGI